MSLAAPPGAERLEALLEARLTAGEAYFAAHAQALARLCHAMAERFARGGRLLALAATPAARSDARHIAVEFVHPVIVGKRALPALALCAEGAPLEDQVSSLAREADMLVGFGDVGAALCAGRAGGCLTVGLAAPGAEWEFPPAARQPDVAQEVFETLYHVLWELVHVFFEHRGLLSGRTGRRSHDAGASAFLYPFLDERESALEPVLDDVRRSILAKSQEVSALRAQTLRENRAVLLEAARGIRERLQTGGTVLALGNGGSATDAMDLVADLRAAGRPALDLAEDSGILTAIANDIGVEAIFARQVIAYGGPGDVLVGLSTSGNSTNLLAALAEARRRGMTTLALAGYDGGRVAAEGLADHVVITRSEHIPRIQEAQASAYHVLTELVA